MRLDGGDMGDFSKGTRINIRLSAAERDDLRRRAELAGVTVSEYVRRRALGDSDRAVVYVDESELKKLFVQLRRVGSNLNQCARELNTHHNPAYVNDALLNAFDAVAKASEDVSGFISESRKLI